MQAGLILPSVAAPIAEASLSSHYFFIPEDISSFTLMLKKPYRHFIEMREFNEMSKVLGFINNEYPHSSLSISTTTAFRQPIADFFTQHLSHLRKLSSCLMNDIRTCLQEAIMNSIIHGNLSVEHDKDNVEDFPHYLERISHAMNDAPSSAKRISIYTWFTASHITICVTDEGDGFDVEQHAEDISKPFGRGLPLIRGLANEVWQLKPNHLSMQFSAHA